MNDWKAFPELLEPAEMARADALTIARGRSGAALMEAAGQAVAAQAVRLCLPASRHRPHVSVLCGPGNNGGDGFVAARILAARGLRVSLHLLGSRNALAGDAAAAAASWPGTITPLDEFEPADTDLVIDAIVGAGLSRDLAGAALSAVRKVNAWAERGGKVLAVDVPTGLDGGTGQVRGDAIRADATVTFFRLKPGHVLMPGRALCGALSLAQIGIGAEVLPEIGAKTFLNVPALWIDDLPQPSAEGHKYTRGHAIVVAGPAARTGAARLAARGALRIGAGLVTVVATPDAEPELAAHLTSIMLSVCPRPADIVRLLGDRRKNALVIGPGLGLDPTAHERLAAALEDPAGRAIVLDADAITLAAKDTALLRRQRRGGGAPRPDPSRRGVFETRQWVTGGA